jgi:hypothetical protein
MVDPGVGVARDKIVAQFTEHTEDYQTLIGWIDTQLNDPDFRARQFRPKLMFDKGEKWRPLNVDVYLNEQNPVDGQPVQCIGVSRSTCEPSEGLATLRAHHSPNDRIFQGDALTSGAPVSADDYSTTDVTCDLDPPGADYTLQDCDNGPAATIYYNALTRSSGYNYFDYWFFYRYNQFTADDHEADWEHVTVAQSATDPNTFDWVQFFQHTYSSDYSTSEGGLGGNYLRENLSCDAGGQASCGSDQTNTQHGHRVWVYVAGGSQASYPLACTNACAQRAVVSLEGDHGGQAPWSANDDPSSLVAFPAAVGWLDPDQGNWTDWPGRWGEQGAPASPGSHVEFKCPWNGNPDDATACSARARTTARAASISKAGARCAGWYGESVIAAACTPSALRPAVRRGHLGNVGRVRLRVQGRHRRSASATGIAQAVGAPLRPGDRVVVRGHRASDTEIMVRGVYGAKSRQWIVRHLDWSPSTVTITLPMNPKDDPRVVHAPVR